MLLSTIKADLRKRITAAFPRPEQEPEYGITIRNSSDFENELLQELQQNLPPKTLPRRRVSDEQDNDEDFNDTQDIPETQFLDDNCE